MNEEIQTDPVTAAERKSAEIDVRIDELHRTLTLLGIEENTVKELIELRRNALLGEAMQEARASFEKLIKDVRKSGIN